MQTNYSRYVLSIITAFVLLAALVVTSAYGVSGARSTVVEIPFDFHVAGKTLRAGRYVVTRSTLASAEGLSLRNLEGNGGAYVLTSTVRAGERQSESHLVFTRYGESYFLSQYWASGESTGRALIRTDRDRELQNEMAKSGLKPERVTVVIARK